MTIKDVEKIIEVSGLTDKDKMEIASHIMLEIALDTGLDTVNNLYAETEEVIKNLH